MAREIERREKKTKVEKRISKVKESNARGSTLSFCFWFLVVCVCVCRYKLSFLIVKYATCVF